MFSVRRSLAIAAAMLLAVGPAAQAYIDPDFTPLQLVEQADKAILVLKFRPGQAPQTLDGTVVRAFRGKTKVGETVTISLKEAVHEAQAEDVAKAVAAQQEVEGMIFAGNFEGEAGGGGAAQQKPDAWLHLGTRWLGLFADKDGGYEMSLIETKMEGTWAGSTDMLARCVEYVLTDPAPDVPVTTEVEWGDHVQFAEIKGKALSAIAVHLDGKSADHLFVASPDGDHLFAFDGKELTDVTAKRKLAGKSLAAAWGDFNRDGRLDLASWDGKALTVHYQGADGTFAAKPVGGGETLKDVVGLAVVDVGKGQVGLLVSTPKWPVLVRLAEQDKAAIAELGAGELPRKELKSAGACVVGDFDGDQVPDVLQLFENGGLFYKGKGDGAFDKPAQADIARGKGMSAPSIGDFDGDGMLDVFVASEDRCRLWHNEGKLRFLESLGFSGEIAYISKDCGISSCVGDVNNDGRQDVLICYEAMAPQIFFNRGFRSTGHSHDLDLAEKQLLPEAEEGIQAGCLGDFNGDGAQDMALVLKNGQCWVFYRELLGGRKAALAVKVSLPPDGPFAGPLTVVGYDDKIEPGKRLPRCLGAWNVVAGSSQGFFGKRDPGVVTLRWQLPGGQPQDKQITLDDKDDKPTQFVIPVK